MNNKVTNEMKKTMRDMRDKGIPNCKIASIFCLAQSTVMYHNDPIQKQKTIARAIKNQKTRDRTDYNREYQRKRYQTDPEFREKVKEANRLNQRRKSGVKNNGTK